MKLKIFCRSYLFPSWSGRGLISTPVQEPCKWPLEVVIFLSHLEVQYKAGLANMRPSRKASAALGLLNSFSNAIKHNITGLQNILRILLAEIIFFILAQEPPSGPRPPPHYRGFMVTLRHTTLGRTPLNTWSSRRRDLYLTTHNTYNRQTSTPPAGFEPTIPASERPQTHALDPAATGIGRENIYIL